MQPPKPWKEFFSLERMQEAYGRPSTYADVSSRITENIYTYMGNYLRMSLVCVLCVLYKRPSALVGVVLTAKAWDWLRINSAGVDQQSYSYKIKYTAIYIFTWAVIVFSSVTGAMLLAALISALVVCFHGTFLTVFLTKHVRKERKNTFTLNAGSSTDSSADRDGRRALIDIIKGSVPAALRESHQQEHAALRYPAGVDPQPILAREQRLVRDNRVPDWRPTDETRKLSLYNRLDPIFYAAVKQPQPQHRGKQHPRGFRMGAGNPPAVGFDRDSMKAQPLCHRCRKAGKGEVYHPYRDCPLGGRQHSPATAAAFCIPIEQEDAEGLHALALVQVFQDAADIGPEAFSHAALAYGPPAVLSTDGVGGIDVAAYGFSVPSPPSGGTDDEDILRRLDALTSEVQAAQDKVEDVEPAPTQSARVTTTETTCGEFGGFVQAP
ncbi:hypothetical protein CYMTET_53372 [Cymbomonas tetramitiformis]|uniref:PRA1 family protein n=1 Tax=Cymbomonas tetramitiformis TaxID=36881 RepID=A0AAE0ERT2_9CHLO|nr:hypothetical protein CYMTET_53372 [Cymbomonas tetramitiformis]